MSLISRIKLLVHENQFTGDSVLFHCAVCDVKIACKSKFLSHINDQTHSYKTSKTYDDVNLTVQKLIREITNILGEQHKFIVPNNTKQNVFNFTCVLCDVQLNGYFVVLDHTEQRTHRTRVELYNSLKQAKCNNGSKKSIDQNFNNGIIMEDKNIVNYWLQKPVLTFDKSTDDNFSNLEEENEHNEVLQRERYRKVLFSDFNSTVNIVSYLTSLYGGVLSCRFCKETIPFELNSVLDHDEQCNSSVAIKIKSMSMLDRFQQFCQIFQKSNKISDSNFVHNEKLFSVSSFQTKVHNFEMNIAFNSLIKFFQCLSCHVAGSITEWENHLSQHSLWQEDNPLINCFCLLCRRLLFGDVANIAKHEHFKISASCENYLNMNYKSFVSPSQMISLLEGDSELPRYYNFTLKLSRKQKTCTAKYSFYCSVCDCFGFQKIEKHFASYEHRLKANILNDLCYCQECMLVLYSNNLLLEHHKLSLVHTCLRRTKYQQSAHLKNNIHDQLLGQLKIKIVQACNLSNYQFSNNFQNFAFFCAPCKYVIHDKDEWLTHLCSNEHNQENIKVVSNVKSFEYTCIFCKLSLYGTIDHQLQHTTSAGHALIKSIVLHQFNKQQVRELFKIRCKSTSKNPSNKSAYESDNENVKKNIVQYMPLSPETTNSRSNIDNSKIKTALPELTELTSRDKDISIYLKKVNNHDIASVISILQIFLHNSLEKCGHIKCKSFNCWFCAYFCSEKSWWAHLKHPIHVKTVSAYLKQNNLTESIALFCRDCKIMLYGSSRIETFHIRTYNHQRRSKCIKQSQIINKHDNESSFSRLEHLRTESNYSDSFDDNLPSRENIRNILTKKSKIDISLSKENSYNHHESNSNRSLSFSSNTGSTFDNTEEKFSSADDYFDCDECIPQKRGESDIDVEGEEEEEEDQNDTIYDMLVQDENGVERDKMTSDEELDETILNELKKNLILNTQSDTLENTDLRLLKDINEQSINEKQKEIIKHLVVVRGIPAQALKNKRIMFSTFSKYGEIKRTFVKKSDPDSLYILVNKDPEDMFIKLKRNIENLKIKLGTDELIVENGTRNNEFSGLKNQLSADAVLLFSNRKELNEGIYYLIQKYDKETKNCVSRMKIKNLEIVIFNLAHNIYRNSTMIKVYVFGSRVTGLATEKSDVDIYLQIGNSFRGSIHNCTRLQQELVMLFANNMRLYPQEFKNVTSIPFARVPIVKFTHIKSDLNCDLSFKSGLSTMNSILVRTYLDLDERVKFLICAVKLWMKLNDLADRNLFTTYAQIWMVLFFLMQADIAVVPTVLALRHMLPEDQKEFTVEDWNCSFPNITNIIWRSTCNLSNEKLLYRFFEFYSNFNLNNYVLCTLTGIKIEKKHFLEFYDNLPLIFKHYKFKLKNDLSLQRIIRSDFEGLCIQDPFDHSHNLTKTINDRKFRSFVDICRDMVEILRQTLLLN